MKIFSKCGSVLFTKIMCNTSNCKIHFTKTPCFSLTFLTNNRNLLTITVMTVNKLHTLNKHTARTTTRVIYHSAVWLNHLSNKFYNTCRSIEFTIFLCSRSRVNLKEVFINTTNKVFFLESLLINLIYIINKVFNLRFISTKCSKQI